MTWFSKWFINEETPIDEVYEKLLELEEKYNNLLCDVTRLEEENIETSNVLYELMNSIEAVDRRIDVLAERCRTDFDV